MKKYIGDVESVSLSPYYADGVGYSKKKKPRDSTTPKMDTPNGGI